MNKFTRNPERQRQLVLEYLKGQLRELFADVHERVEREAASRRTGTRS